MPAKRGSTARLRAAPEPSLSILPTPVIMQELAPVGFSLRSQRQGIRSRVLNSTPFLPRMADGPRIYEVGIDWEMGSAHDLLLESFLGGPFIGNEAKFQDGLKTLVLEVDNSDGLYDHLSAFHMTGLTISMSGSDTAPIQCRATARALHLSFDDPATVAEYVVPSDASDPFTFIDAQIKIDGVATKIVSASVTLDRRVDRLMEWGDADPTEVIPANAMVTGTLMVAYRDGAQSARYRSFANAKQEYILANRDGSRRRVLTIHKTRYLGFGKSVTTRGVRMQEIKWEGQIDLNEGTVATFTRVDDAGVSAFPEQIITGLSHVIVPADANKTLVFTSDHTVLVYADDNLPEGFVCGLKKGGTGDVLFAKGLAEALAPNNLRRIAEPGAYGRVERISDDFVVLYGGDALPPNIIIDRALFDQSAASGLALLFFA